MRSRISLWVLAVTLLSLLLTTAAAGSGLPQAADEPAAACTANLPPVISARIMPSRVVYLGSAAGSTAPVVIAATGTIDPEGQPLYYGCEADGDGVFTPWFFHEPCAENVTMAGPFVATLQVRDEGNAVARQSFAIEARQFEHSYVYPGWGAPALASIAGRPAVTFLGMDGLLFAINSRSDGGGVWTSARVLAIDFARQSGETTSRRCPLAVVAGRPAVACAYRTADGYPLMFAHNPLADGSGKWEVETAVALAGDSAPALGSIQAGPAITYFQSGAVNLLVGRGALGPDPVMVSENFEFLWSFDVGQAPPMTHSGVVQVGEPVALPAVAFLDAQKGALTYAVNRHSDGRGQWDLVTVEPQSGDIGEPALAMLNGRPAIAYRDGAKGDLKVALAGTPDGRGEWKVKVVAPRTGAPRTQSLALIDGRAAVAYEDGSRGLVFAYDPGFDNGDYWPTVVVESRAGWAASNATMSPSLALTAGRPGIAYNSVGGIQFATAR